MAYSARCLKFVVLTFTVLFAVSGVVTVVFSVANLVHFYAHNRFVPSCVTVPVLLLALAGLAACLVAAVGWCGAMAGNTCRLRAFSVFLIVVIMSEFGASIYALMSRTDFKADVTKAMEESFSNYTNDKAVAEDWKSLQKELECCGVDGPNNYRSLGMMDWSCCLAGTRHEGTCHGVNQRGCLESLTHEIQRRLLWLSLLGIAAAIGQMTGVLCSCCLLNSLRNEKRRNRVRNVTSLNKD
ncbi:CD63 antigen-like isoform X2 [Cryptotermes secundus]|uniref:CD63 antigen-like isoform X2 n=1 Tax=Cryptotermes secundus TaxID=105785 RepID=UPI000CD7DB95|nr:CD63 antigen-like isoform X2 [Cryptotermes secundus]